MLWQEDTNEIRELVSDKMVDVSFDMQCQSLPVDHLYALSQAIQAILPWLKEEPLAGVHSIHGAASGHGWHRPEGQGDVMYLSRRTKLILRIPRHRFDDVQALNEQTLDILGNSLTVGSNNSEKTLKQNPVLFARYIVADSNQEEEMFLTQSVMALQDLDIHCRKILCGKTRQVLLEKKQLFTRSLMVADLEPLESIVLQEQGLGANREMGCGLFIPHKGIRAVAEREL